MNIKFATLTLLSLLDSFIMFGQEPIITNDFKFVYQIFGNLEKENSEGYLTIDSVQIRDIKSNRTIQTIRPNANFENPNHHELFKIVDINYDGNNDFIVLTSNGQYRDVIYDFYIYDVSSNHFIRWDKEFNDGANMINVRPTFDEVKRTITTYWHNTGTYQKTSVFKFENGDYQLVEEFNQEPGSDSTGRFVLMTHKKLVEGKWKLVESEKIPLN